MAVRRALKVTERGHALPQISEIGMKMSTCLPLALRILPSAPLAFKNNNYGGLPHAPPRMGWRPYEPRYFHPKVAATGHERCFAGLELPSIVGASLW
jgi:hypothetical protein